MTHKELISIRLDKDIIDGIDELCKKHSYQTRSRIIRSLLIAFLKCADEKSIFNLIESYDPYDDRLKLKIYRV